jgi:cellulose synthase/poly-beta-1,6-N-acetylglucosamine synthase-like glycosyltransferase
MQPEGSTAFGMAVAEAMQSPMTIGPGRFHHSTAREDADTVYLGAIRRTEFLRLGGYRTLPSHVAEDADFAYRIRRSGGRVVLDPSIRSIYAPRENPYLLWRQFFRYGRGKADMLYVNGRWPSWRPVAPLLLLTGLIAGLGLGLTVSWRPLLILLAVWLTALAVAARLRPLVVLAGAIMHLAYGFGLWRGLFRSPRRVRAAVR